MSRCIWYVYASCKRVHSRIPTCLEKLHSKDCKHHCLPDRTRDCCRRRGLEPNRRNRSDDLANISRDMGRCCGGIRSHASHAVPLSTVSGRWASCEAGPTPPSVRRTIRHRGVRLGAAPGCRCGRGCRSVHLTCVLAPRRSGQVCRRRSYHLGRRVTSRIRRTPWSLRSLRAIARSTPHPQRRARR